MAIVNIKEGYTGSVAGGTGKGLSLKLTTTRVFTVLCDSPTDGPLFDWPISDGTTTIPFRGTEHPDNPYYKSCQPQVDTLGPGFYKVKVPYESPDLKNPENTDEDPLLVDAEYSWDDETRSLPYDYDLDGNPVVNGMLQVLDPLPTREISDPVLIIERNQAAFDPNDKYNYQDTICSETFYGVDVGKVRMGKIKARSINAEIPYWRVRYEIIFRVKIPTGVEAAKAWYNRTVDRSTYYWNDSAHTKLKQSSDGKPVMLKGDGTKAATVSEANILYFKEFPDASWLLLALGF